MKSILSRVLNVRGITVAALLIMMGFLTGCAPVNSVSENKKSELNASAALKAKESDQANNRVLSPASPKKVDWHTLESDRILARVPEFIGLPAITVTAQRAERSAGGKHDFYSEGDYWWPNPENPEGPYVKRDGETNPDNFLAHRKAMVRLADIIGTLASAYVISADDNYAKEAAKHLDAWFVSKETYMRPALEYAQAIKGKHTGRSIGVIDTLHLVEVARGVEALESAPSMQPIISDVKAWFNDYLHWLNTHPYGVEEKTWPNNHGVCWSLQAASFASLVDDTEQFDWIESQFKNVYLKQMMNKEGGFKDELTRTKPYGYSLFIVDVMAGVAQLLDNQGRNAWHYETESHSGGGRSMALGLEFIYPYIQNKNSWPYLKDILYWDDWPVRHSSLLFAGVQLDKPKYLIEWKKGEADPQVMEVKRNLPIRYPLLWGIPKA